MRPPTDLQQVASAIERRLLGAGTTGLDEIAGHAAALEAQDPALAREILAAGALRAAAAEGLFDGGGRDDAARAVAEIAGVDPLRLALRTLHDPRLLALPLESLLDAALALLEALGGAREPSVWLPNEAGAPRLLRWRTAIPSPDAPYLARACLAGESPATDGPTHVVAVRRFDRAVAALVHRPDGLAAHTAAAATAELLSPAFERAAFAAASIARSATLVRSLERRMTRVGFDLHDGALQDVSLLHTELDDLRNALRGADAVDPALVTRVEDLLALAGSLDDDLREVARSLDGSAELRQPFAEVLEGIVRGFGIRTGIEPEIELSGDVDGLSHSLRIALIRVVQECLSNVRNHSEATVVRIAIAAGTARVEATVEDDGRGFDVPEALREAARGGRMGLLGIVERVRLLGGFCDIQSAPGEGCRVTLTLAAWTTDDAAGG